MTLTPADIASRLDLDHINQKAHRARVNLRIFGHAAVVLEPGDCTRYTIAIVKHDDEFWFGSSFGPIYPWDGGQMHVDYVRSKWVADDTLWTAVVFTEFMNALARELAES